MDILDVTVKEFDIEAFDALKNQGYKYFTMEVADSLADLDSFGASAALMVKAFKTEEKGFEHFNQIDPGNNPQIYEVNEDPIIEAAGGVSGLVFVIKKS